MPADNVPARTWTFLSNHGHVLILLSQDADARLRDIAAAVGVTERAATAIINDLEAAGYLTRSREGRRNHYTVHKHQLFRHQLEAGHSIDELLRIFR
ncbi:MAG: MarR family transcriptional regulator [Actinobacteria bacterium]|jgi:hypothetical protein|nr:MarR family transcriptional regulator [Actinomycetota bacterium]